VIDPRSSVVGRRLEGVGRIVGFTSAKGGVGKTTCACLSAAALAAAGRRVGLLDLDLQGASAHVFLGLRADLPAEDRGVLPAAAADRLLFMSAALFAGDRALALRGPEVSDAILELLAVTRWGSLDLLVIDMPPGLGEEILDVTRLVPRLEPLVVSTPEALSVSVVERLLDLLRELRKPAAGVIANMARGDARPVREMAERSGAAFLGAVPFDPGLEACVGDPARLAGTGTAAALARLLARAGID
jgi:ATP-binding protein involved in chromosome partitioning